MIDDARIDAVIAKTLESVPAGATHWSTRTMAGASGLSQTVVSRIWRAFGLQPHRQETFKLSTDPMYMTFSVMPATNAAFSAQAVPTDCSGLARDRRRLQLDRKPSAMVALTRIFPRPHPAVGVAHLRTPAGRAFLPESPNEFARRARHAREL